LGVCRQEPPASPSPNTTPACRNCPLNCSDADTAPWLFVAGYELEAFTADMGKFWHHITGDSQLRWIGPDKGAIHLATGAVVNAVWDLYAKQVRTQQSSLKRRARVKLAVTADSRIVRRVTKGGG
jgi:L-alanine-DL-glutamate epimerase-like enolase superfamily enzyme